MTATTPAPPAGSKSRILPLLIVAAVLGGLLYWDRFAGGGDADVVKPSRPPPGGSAPAPGPVSPGTDLRQRSPTAPGSVVDPLGLNPLAELKLADLDATIKRPLFEVTRRPVEPPKAPPPPPPPKRVAAPPEPPPPIPAFKLFGVLSSDSGGMAIIGHPGLVTPMRLEIGDTIEGWRVEKIEPNRVVLVRGKQRTELHVFGRPG